MTDTVMMGCSIDVSDMSDEQVTLVQQMANVFEEQFALFVEKNRGYGNVFETGGHSEMQRDEPVFDTPFEANLYRLWCRIQDKDNRFYSQAFGESDEIEDVDETSGDAANYWMMVTLLSRYRAPLSVELDRAKTEYEKEYLGSGPESALERNSSADDYLGTEPGEWKELNPTADELFDEEAAIRLQVREFVVENEPASLRDVKQKFGEEGQDALYELIDEGVVEDTGTWKYRIVDESAESDDGCGCKHCGYYKQS